MKKVLLTSAAILAVFGAAAPVFAQGDASSSNRLNQKAYVSEADIAAQAASYAADHAADIQAKALEVVGKEADYPAVKAAQAALENIPAGHDYETKAAAANQALATAKAEYAAKLADTVSSLTNSMIARQQDALRTAAQAQGIYWNDATGIEDNKPNDQRIKEDQERNGVKPADQNNNGGQTDNTKPADNNGDSSKPADGKTAPTQEQTDKAKADAKKTAKAAAKTTAGKVAAKSGAKTLPNTAAVK